MGIAFLSERHIPEPGEEEGDIAHHERLVRQIENTPNVDFMEVIFYLNQIPAGKWEQPEPYIVMGELVSKKDAEDSFIVPLMEFINEAKKGYDITSQFREKGGPVNAHNAHIHLKRLINFLDAVQSIGAPHDTGVAAILESITRAIGSLLSAENRVALGVLDQTPPSAEDILNAKKFVNYWCRRTKGFGLREFEKKD